MNRKSRKANRTDNVMADAAPKAAAGPHNDGTMDPGLEDAIHRDLWKAAGDDIQKAFKQLEESGTDVATHGILVIHEKWQVVESFKTEDGRPGVFTVTRTDLARYAPVRKAIEQTPHDVVPVVLVAGSSMSVERLVAMRVSPAMKEAYQDINGVSVCTVRGLLFMIFSTELADVKEGPNREKIRRFQSTAHMAYVREKQKPYPRPIDQFLYEEFDGKGVESALARGDMNRALEIILVPRARGPALH